MLAIVAILVAVWFYRAATKAKKDNVWLWVAVAVVAYYAAGILWVYGVLPYLFGRRLDHPSILMGLSIEASGILVAVLVVWWIRVKLLPMSSG